MYMTPRRLNTGEQARPDGLHVYPLLHNVPWILKASSAEAYLQVTCPGAVYLSDCPRAQVTAAPSPVC